MSASLATYAAAVAAGAALGALYLALLWASVRALVGPRSGLAFAGLALARAALVIAALVGAIRLGVGTGELLAALAGFIALRVLATRFARASGGRSLWK